MIGKKCTRHEICQVRERRKKKRTVHGSINMRGKKSANEQMVPKSAYVTQVRYKYRKVKVSEEESETGMTYERAKKTLMYIHTKGN